VTGEPLRIGFLGRPRPMPRRVVPVAAGGFVVAVALPIFLVAGWRLTAWALAALLWVAGQGFALLLARLRVGMGNLASSGVVAMGMMFRSLAVMVVLVAYAIGGDAKVAAAAAAVYALAYTAELSLSVLSYYGTPVE
jgi:hypothetical protein